MAKMRPTPTIGIARSTPRLAPLLPLPPSPPPDRTPIASEVIPKPRPPNTRSPEALTRITAPVGLPRPGCATAQLPSATLADRVGTAYRCDQYSDAPPGP